MQLVEDFFRHEYGRLVSILTGRVGTQHVQEVEDAVQAAMEAALTRWPAAGPPRNPSAWLFRVARNHLLGTLRTDTGRQRLLRDKVPPASPPEVPVVFLSGEVRDDLLRMLFVCCDEALPTESALVLALKTLCGFSVSEIAVRLFTTPEAVYKRLARARDRLRASPPDLDALSPTVVEARLPAVQQILYLLFTEGYLSSHPEAAIRQQLCDEAVRLGTLLAEHPLGQTPRTWALLALMHFHGARIAARQDGAGGLLLLEEQERERWDATRIRTGLDCLARSAEGPAFSRYHAEAAIAAEHCLAPSFAQTRWQRVAALYEVLEGMTGSPVHTLNRAVALAEAQGPEEGLAVLAGLQPPTWLVGSYMWSAVLADLHGRAGHAAKAARHRRAAMDLAPSEAVRALLQRRLGA
ncbi:MAG: sigma-70 family RNA polymerase sigma factor [Myxococcales bacterium]|nr:sigma-70 family RNA polymerase sigma factor [Myxococcales bacterium]